MGHWCLIFVILVVPCLEFITIIVTTYGFEFMVWVFCRTDLGNLWGLIYRLKSTVHVGVLAEWYMSLGISVLVI
jgi:hypothetical protein